MRCPNCSSPKPSPNSPKPSPNSPKPSPNSPKPSPNSPKPSPKPSPNKQRTEVSLGPNSPLFSTINAEGEYRCLVYTFCFM